MSAEAAALEAATIRQQCCKHESFRLKDKRRAGLLDKSASADPGRTSAPNTCWVQLYGQSMHRPGRAGTWLEVKVRNGQRHL